MTNEEQLIEANQKYLAAAITSIGLANAMSWVAVAALLADRGVMPADQFADLASKLAALLEVSAPNNSEVGAAMLRQVHDILRRQNPPRWKPTIVA